MKTTIYLIKHEDELKENGIKNVKDNTQLINEKYILSVKGEEQSRQLSENKELENIDVLWSSSYARAKATAKYIATNVVESPQEVTMIQESIKKQY